MCGRQGYAAKCDINYVRKEVFDNENVPAEIQNRKA